MQFLIFISLRHQTRGGEPKKSQKSPAPKNFSYKILKKSTLEKFLATPDKESFTYDVQHLGGRGVWKFVKLYERIFYACENFNIEGWGGLKISFLHRRHKWTTSKLVANFLNNFFFESPDKFSSYPIFAFNLTQNTETCTCLSINSCTKKASSEPWK